MAPERSAAAAKEVEELKRAGIHKETRYQTWVANTIMEKKTDGSWRICVDFTDINKACPKDCYSLPEIDWKVDSISDFKLKCFLDAYKGYHQIQMAKEDEHKTAFHAPKGVYCYKKMHFGLKTQGSLTKGKGLLGPRGGRCRGNGGRGGSMAGRGGRSSRESKNVCGEVGEVEKMSSTGSTFMVRGEECLEGCVGAGRGKVNRGGDDFRVSKSLLGEILKVVIGESGGEVFGDDGGAVW
ncbi:hypothetical protein Tco_0980914 [Tanacetum coccineum]